MNILCEINGNDEDRYEKAIFKHFVILNKLFNCYIDELLNKEFIDTVFVSQIYNKQIKSLSAKSYDYFKSLISSM